MANSDVRVGVDGELFKAPAGTALPADASTDPIAPFVSLGNVSEDGATESSNNNTNPIRRWDGSTVRTVQTEHSVQVSLRLIDTSDVVLQEFYKDPSGARALTKVTAATAGRGAYVLVVHDGDYRIHLEMPDAEPVEFGDITYVNSDAVGYEITYECYPDDTADAVKIYKRMAVPV